MGLLSALNLPRPKSWPAEAGANAPVATRRPAPVVRKAEAMPAGGPQEEEDEEEPARVHQPNGNVTETPTARAPGKDASGADAPTPADDGGRSDPGTGTDAEADVPAETGPAGQKSEAQVPTVAKRAEEPAAAPGAAEGEPERSSTPPRTEEIGYGDFSLGLKEAADGASLIVKWEHKETVARENFKVWVIPCYVKADLKIGIEGEIVIKGKGDRQLAVKSGGALELGVGGSSEAVTAGPYGEVALSASTKVPTRLSEAREIAMNPFVVDIYGTGKVGIKFELKDSWSRNSDCELANWHLFIVHVGAYQNGSFGAIRVEPGKDMQRLIAALQKAGPAIADAVEKYAPEKLKKAAEDGAKWVAESDDAKNIADKTGVVLDKIKKETGVDIGDGAERVVRDLVDPGGETSAEATKRVEAEMAALNSTHEAFMGAVQNLGLAPGGPLQSLTNADKDEYNAIVEVHRKEMNQSIFAGTPPGAWKPLLVALATKRRQRKAAQAAQEVERKKRQQADADAQAIADLARRVKAAEARMNAAEQAANGPGNLLNNKAPQGSKKRQYWTQGMKFRDPATLRKMQVASLQGEARIAKADEATALFLKAKVVFEQGTHVTE